MIKKRYILILFVILYLGEGLFLSWKVYSLGKESFQSAGKSKNEDVISQEDFWHMGICSDGVENEVCEVSFPITIHWFIGAKSIYFYKYGIYNKGETVSYAEGNCKICLMLKHGKFKVIAVERPEEASWIDYRLYFPLLFRF